MWNDVLNLADFYASRTGQVTRHLIRRQIRQLWPDTRGEVVLGLGYATPYLRQFRGEAERMRTLPAGSVVLPTRRCTRLPAQERRAASSSGQWRLSEGC